jgi:hypothetical protein
MEGHLVECSTFWDGHHRKLPVEFELELQDCNNHLQSPTNPSSTADDSSEQHLLVSFGNSQGFLQGPYVECCIGATIPD